MAKAFDENNGLLARNGGDGRDGVSPARTTSLVSTMTSTADSGVASRLPLRW